MIFSFRSTRIYLISFSLPFLTNEFIFFFLLYFFLYLSLHLKCLYPCISHPDVGIGPGMVWEMQLLYPMTSFPFLTPPTWTSVLRRGEGCKAVNPLYLFAISGRRTVSSWPSRKQYTLRPVSLLAFIPNAHPSYIGVRSGI